MFLAEWTTTKEDKPGFSSNIERPTMQGATMPIMPLTLGLAFLIHIVMDIPVYTIG